MEGENFVKKLVCFIIYIFLGSKKEQGISAMNIGSLFH